MKKATYYADLGNPNPVVVIKENIDGTIDIGTDAEHPTVTNCPVSEKPKVGHCVVDGGASAKAAKAEAAEEAKEAKAEAAAERKHKN